MGVFVSLLLIVFGAEGVSQVHNVVALPLMVGVVTSVLGILQWPALGFLFYTFPDGRFVPRWSWLLSLLFLLQVGFFLLPFPYGITNWPWFLALLDLLIVYGSALGTQFYRRP